MAPFEDGLYAYLSSQSNITSITGSRIYPSILPQKPDLPAIVFESIGSNPVSRQDGKPTLEISRYQIDCYARTSRDAKILAQAVRDSLESYVGMMGTHKVQAVFVLDFGVGDFDDVPNDFRNISEYEIWHTIT